MAIKGGVAKTYTQYLAAGKPYKEEEGARWYVEVKHPKNGNVKTVRWYKDTAHEGMIPVGFEDWADKIAKNNTANERRIFGFKDINDWVWIIPKSFVTEEEAEQFFGWKHGWNGCALFDTEGCWYAPKGSLLPTVKNPCYLRKTWAEWVEAGYNHTKNEGVFDIESSVWTDCKNELEEEFIGGLHNIAMMKAADLKVAVERGLDREEEGLPWD